MNELFKMKILLKLPVSTRFYSPLDQNICNDILLGWIHISNDNAINRRPNDIHFVDHFTLQLREFGIATFAEAGER